MFWKRKKESATAPRQPEEAFEDAKEATRRAVFLNNAGKGTSDQEQAAGLRQIFEICRSELLKTGAVIGKSAEEIDAEMNAVCDHDAERLKAGSDQQLVDFSTESGQIINRFLADRGIA